MNFSVVFCGVRRQFSTLRYEAGSRSIGHKKTSSTQRQVIPVIKILIMCDQRKRR